MHVRPIRFLMLFAALGCTGAIGTEPPAMTPAGGEPTADGTPRAPATPAPATAPPTVPPPSVVPPAGGAACSDRTVTAGAAPIRRLTNREYLQAVRDLLGETEDVTADFPPDPEIGGFDNSADALAISPVLARRYLEAAERAAVRVTASPERLTKVVGCAPSEPGRATCLRQFVERFGRRAFRRPLAPRETDALLAVAGPAADGPEAVRRVLEAVLQSPKFLFRVEVGAADRPGALTGYEVATRLSFLLLGTTPPDGLLDAAAAGKLDAPAGVVEVARGLLADPRAREVTRTFFTQWMALGTLDDATRDAKAYPLWNDALKAAMREETRRFVDDVVWGREQGLLDVFTERTTTVNAALAKLYGQTVAGTGWSKVTLGPERAGILTQASFLTATGASTATPIIRGKIIREAFLCDHPPPAPAGVPPLPEAPPGQVLAPRAELEKHRKDPACAGCHTLLDPLGFGLERFDDIGAYHERDAKGAPISGAGSIAGETDPDFVGAAALGARLKAIPRVADCLPRRLFTYAHGRAETPADACTLTAVQGAFRASGHSWKALLLALVGSPPFSLREGGRP